MKRTLCLLFSALALALCLARSCPAAQEQWREVLPGKQGLDLATLGDEALPIHALRIDPARTDFFLHSARWEGPSRTVASWARAHDLVAVVNAGMYLPDGLTSTGYMRSGKQVNNGRIAGRYGSFFVAGPRRPGLPRADILDKSADDWKARLEEYQVVVQNFRLIGPGRVNLWQPSPERHAVAAIGRDKAGFIYFLLCPTQVSVYDFVQALLALPADVLDLNAAMYVEGGAQAALFVGGQINQTWIGDHPASLFFGQDMREIPLPNILGVRLAVPAP